MSKLKEIGRWLWFWAPVLVLLSWLVCIIVWATTQPDCHMPGPDVVTPEDYRLCVPAYSTDECLEKLGYKKVCE